MDLEAERIQTESTPQSGFGRGRQTIIGSTSVLTVVSIVLAMIGLRLGMFSLERDSAVALASPGPTTAEPSQSSDPVAEDDEPAGSPMPPMTPSTVSTEGRSLSGAAASSSTPPPDADQNEAPGSGRSPDERGRWALTRISYPWAENLPGWTVEFHDGRDGLFGLTMVDDKRIEIYVRTDQTDDLLVHILAHELGHAVDVTLNSGDDRRRWQTVRDIEDEPWWPSSAASDFRTGAGDFAESFAYWQAESENYRSKLGSAPTEAQLELMAELASG